MSWFDKILAGFEITAETIADIQAAGELDSDGGTEITTEEIYEIGMKVVAKIATAAGLKVKVAEKPNGE